MKEIKHGPDKVRWNHPGGKLLRMGTEGCSNADLLAILIGSGLHGYSAEQMAEELMIRYRSLETLSQQPVEKFMEVRGIKGVKAVRLAAAFELGRRLSRV